MINEKNIKGIIFDIDGTLILNGKAIFGAVETLSLLRKAGYCIRFVTNTTSKTNDQIASFLHELGFEINPNEVQTPVLTSINYLSTHFIGKSGYLAIPNEIKPLFYQIDQTDTQPHFVLLGDLDDEFDYAILNKIFNFILEGAQLITFHCNTFYFKSGKTYLDSGAFTKVLEQATQHKATVIGKPNSMMFDNAVKSMKLDRSQVIVVGDDVSSDILGARNADLTAYLVASGKFKPQDLVENEIDSHLFLKQISDLLPLCIQKKATIK